MASQKNIIVLGGGYAGVLTAKHLEKQVRKNKQQKDIKITLIDKNPFHTMLTELHEVACDRVEEESIKMDLKKIFAGRHVDVVLDEINQIDFSGKKLSGKNKEYNYDYLVIGSGSKPTFWGVEGAEENAFTLWSFDDAIRLKESILANFRAAERETDSKKRNELLSFVVVGCGFTGAEMVGELAEWVPILCNQYHIDPKEVKMYNVDMLDRIIPSLPEKQAAKAAKRLIKMGVTIKTKSKVKSVSKDGVTIEVNGKNEKLIAATTIWTAGIEGSEVIQNSQIEKARGSRIETNQFLQSKQYDNVYIVGDNMFYIPEGEKTSVPQMVENCEASAHTCAKNLMSDITNGQKEAYKPKFHGVMVCIGGRYGTAFVGAGKFMFGLPSFFAMFAKHFINILYFLQVLGWNKIYNYLQHEILRVKNNRSFVGGYFSNHSPNFWTLPLRMFLGYKWLTEGLAKLPKILDDPTNIFLFNIPNADGTTAATVVAESATSATPAAEAWGEALPVPDFISGIVDWSMGAVIAPIAPAFQALIVCAEILIGILLIVGLFTAVAAIASFALSFMIYLSGMAPTEMLWYFVAAVALIGIGGTGQVFSLDYYVLPWLKKKWSRLGFVRKLYIYND